MTLAVITSIKDESPYIIDWVAYYRALGFGQIIIAQNDSVDGTDQLCLALADAGYITYLDNADPAHAPADLRGLAAQRRAYGWAQTLPNVQTADYMFLCDIDEYLELPGDASFATMLDRLDHPDIISFAWRMIGSGGAIQFDPAPVTDRFTRAAEPTNVGTKRAFHQMKSAFSPRLITDYNVHRPQNVASDIRWVTPDGKSVNHSATTLPNFDYSHANLRHYHCKSRAEFMVKMVRGYASHGSKPLPQIGLPAFDLMDANDVDLHFSTPTLDEAKIIATEMRADPTIASCEANCIARFTQFLDLCVKAVDKLPILHKLAGFEGDLSPYFKQEIYNKLNRNL